MALLAHIGYVIGGAAAVGVVSAVGKDGAVHDGVVKATAACLRAGDAVSRVVQSIADEASDVNAEACRQAKIDAAVRDRLAAMEDDIRAEVTAEIDA